MELPQNSLENTKPQAATTLSPRPQIMAPGLMPWSYELKSGMLATETLMSILVPWTQIQYAGNMDRNWVFWYHDFKSLFLALMDAHIQGFGTMDSLPAFWYQGLKSSILVPGTRIQYFGTRLESSILIPWPQIQYPATVASHPISQYHEFKSSILPPSTQIHYSATMTSNLLPT